MPRKWPIFLSVLIQCDRGANQKREKKGKRKKELRLKTNSGGVKDKLNIIPFFLFIIFLYFVSVSVSFFSLLLLFSSFGFSPVIFIYPFKVEFEGKKMKITEKDYRNGHINALLAYRLSIHELHIFFPFESKNPTTSL